VVRGRQRIQIERFGFGGDADLFAAREATVPKAY
jgi:hypothetical protein